MLELAAAGAIGKEAGPTQYEIDWNRMISLAEEQTVKHLVAYAIKKAKYLNCPLSVRQALQADLRLAAFANVSQQEAVFAILSELSEQGFSPILLKGYSLAEYYYAPECRISGDVDIWIDPHYEKEACNFFVSKGFSVDARGKNEHHSVCYHPTLGCVELHVFLYGRLARDIWFSNMDERTLVVEERVHCDTGAGPYTTLGYTDNLLFLTLHMMKHFIHSGMSLRMMLDVALFFRASKQLVNVERYWNTLREMRLDYAVQSILWIMISYCGFSKVDFPGVCEKEPANLQMILDDLENGGALGYKEKKQREEGGREYSYRKMVKEMGIVQYRKYMFKWKMELYRKLAFTSKDMLVEKYPVLHRAPCLLPLARIYRFVVRGLKFLFRKSKTRYTRSDTDQVCDIAKDRVRLFQELKMI